MSTGARPYRAILIGLTLALVTVPATAVVGAGASWTQSGYDAQRTGAIPFEGPATNDTAFQVQLPGIPWRSPVIVDGAAYIVTHDLRHVFDGPTEGLDQDALWRVELSSGTVEKVLDLPPFEGGGDTVELLLPGVVLIEEGQDLVAREIPSGEERWRATVRADAPEVAYRFYGGAAVLLDGTVYIEFSTRRGDDTCVGTPEIPGICGVADPEMGGVMAVDLQSGEILWESDRTQWVGDTVASRPLEAGKRQPHSQGFSLAADERQVYVYTQSSYTDRPGPESGFPAAFEYEIWALDAANGRAQWTRNDSTLETYDASAGVGTVNIGGPASFCCGNPLVTPSRLFLRMDAFEAFNKGDGARIWTSQAGQTDQVTIQGSLGMGIRDDALIATSTQSVYRLDPATGGVDWLKTNEDPAKLHSTTPVAIDQETAYVRTIIEDECFAARGIDARDLVTGELRWTWSYQPTIGTPCGTILSTAEHAFAPGLIVYPTKDGTVTVLGETEASIGAPPIQDTERYPAEGEEVTIEVPEPEPGAFGPATRYMVDWGDGTVTGWQTSPVFEHAYNESGAVEARVIAGNDANQTSSTLVTMNVGQEAPAEPNWISERFDPENQDMTFGVLGILVAVTGGAIGVGARYRRRSRLEAELEALEKGFEETKHRPGECEALLDNRKGRARSLALDGKLDESQVSIIENRAEELRGKLRVGALEDEFGFLPYSLVVAAREMVEDGHVSTLERRAFLDALEEDEVLSDEQKAVVKQRIEDWYGRDAGGGGSG